MLLYLHILIVGLMIDGRVLARRPVPIETQLAQLEQRVVASNTEQNKNLKQVLAEKVREVETQLTKNAEQIGDLRKVLDEMRQETSHWELVKSIALTVLLMIVLTRLFSVRRPVQRGMWK